MSRTVFILGAGASKAAGSPLMGDFLDVAERLNGSGSVKDAGDAFDLVFEGLAALQSAHSKATINLDNVESVFAAFEMAQLLGSLCDLSIEKIQRLSVAMRRVIDRTIQETVRFPVAQNQIQPPPGYSQLARLVKQAVNGPHYPKDIVTRFRLTDFSVITFNYDICVDFAFHSAGIPIRYYLDQSEDIHHVSVLKLHGSLNWAECSGCGKIVCWPLAEFLRNRTFLLDGVHSVNLSVASRMNDFEHCKGAPVEGPYVVPPTWNKSQYHKELESVWRAAASELSTAENIFICGYSLPDTDQFFRYLYALGTIGDTRLKRLWVFNPDKSVEKTYRSLLGQAVLSRFKCFDKTFEEMFGEIRNLFDLVTNG
jgi:hypothetical protein